MSSEETQTIWDAPSEGYVAESFYQRYKYPVKAGFYLLCAAMVTGTGLLAFHEESGGKDTVDQIDQGVFAGIAGFWLGVMGIGTYAFHQRDKIKDDKRADSQAATWWNFFCPKRCDQAAELDQEEPVPVALNSQQI